MITIGIDVSKEKLDVLWLRDISNRRVKTKIFKNDTDTYQLIVDWVLKQTQSELHAIKFIMEATGVYHEQLAHALFEQGARVFVINPARIKAHAMSLGQRGKTDKKDSFTIAHYGASMTMKGWQPEPIEIRTLKALIRRYQAVDKDFQRELNRLEKVMISQVSEVVLSSIRLMLEVLENQKLTLQSEIDQHINQYPHLKKDRSLLQSIPGVGPVIATLMLSVIGSRDFTSAKSCAAFLGLNPVLYESGSSVHRRPRMSKMGDASVRAKLYMAAVVATRHNPDIKRQYERLLRNGKSKMSAIGAAMRKLVQICFGVLKHQSKYQPQFSVVAG